MKLVRFGPAGQEKPGIVDADGKIRDLSSIVPDIAGDALSPSGLTRIRNAAISNLPVVPAGTRIGPCVGKVGNLIAIGLNYADHAAEAGMQIPKEPIIFNKAPNCVCGPNDDTMVPKDSTKLDYEIELGIVIGSRARYLTQDKAMDATSRSVNSRSSAPVNGPRERAARHSARSVLGSLPKTRFRTRRTSICSSP
jgi:2-keto-4-pentenoate hydratase/2-oxohepta-3-ene-1,7-dioic acid hydratase in catechol pathway